MKLPGRAPLPSIHYNIDIQYYDPKIDTFHTALPDNEFKAKINMFVIVVGLAYSRSHIINVSNLNLEKAYGSSMAYLMILLIAGDTINLRDSNFKNYDSTASSIWITAGIIELKNITFEDIPSHPNGHVLIDYSDTINIEGITFRNFTGHSSPIGHLISLTNNPTQSGTIKDIVIEDSDLKNQKAMVFSATSPVQSLSFERITFSNLRYSESSNLIQIASVKNLAINTLIFNNVSSSSSVDITSSSFLVSQIDLNSTENIEIGEIQYQNSSISLISMPTFISMPQPKRLINFKNMEFTSSYLVSQVPIIRTEGIQYDLDLVLNFDNLTFSDIEFKSKGYLLNLDQQLPSNLTISNSRFVNIKQGIINIASTKVENPDLLASVHLSNITAENIQENEASFLNVEQEGRLFVSDSSFKSMYIYQDGGVLSGGSSNTITVISNSTFENNSALNGGVFNVKEQSVIKIYSCNITSNFAITSGVINVVSNGHFEIYDSLIYNNHANKNPVSQLLDTAETSVISNSKIYLNHAFSKASIISEFSSCSQL